MNKPLDYLKEDLAQRVTTVTFRKANGEVRVMECTRNLDLVPPSMWPKGKIEEDVDSETLRVFDVKAQGWRSFNVNRCIEVKSDRLAMKWPQ